MRARVGNVLLAYAFFGAVPGPCLLLRAALNLPL